MHNYQLMMMMMMMIKVDLLRSAAHMLLEV
jgi:hypothetical protein